jgi:hypothetical protein
MALDFPNSPTVGQTFNNEWIWDGVKWAAIGPGYHDVGRNLLHNGLFNVAQRGAGPWTVTNGYTADRWSMSYNLDAISTAIVAAPDTTRAAIGDEACAQTFQPSFTGTAGAAAFSYVSQPIEGVRRLSAKTATLSFWAWCGTGTLRLGASFDQFFGSGGSPSAPVTNNGQSVALTTTPQRFALTFSLPSVAGKTLGTSNDDHTTLNFWLSSGTTQASRAGNIGVQSGTIALWGVQLELGATATPLEKLDPQQDLAKCQRFYQSTTVVYGGYNVAGNNLSTVAYFPVWMRAAPTVTPGANSGFNTGAVTNSPGQGWMVSYATVTATGSAAVNQSMTLSADL